MTGEIEPNTQSFEAPAEHLVGSPTEESGPVVRGENPYTADEDGEFAVLTALGVGTIVGLISAPVLAATTRLSPEAIPLVSTGIGGGTAIAILGINALAMRYDRNHPKS